MPLNHEDIIDQLHRLIQFSITDAYILGSDESAESDSISEIRPLNQVFLRFGFDSAPESSLVFFLSGDETHIETAVQCQSDSIENLLPQEVDTTKLFGIDLASILNPVFIRGDERIHVAYILISRSEPGHVIGVFFEFAFRVIFGLQVFDDGRLSMCFNSMASEVLRQALDSAKVDVQTVRSNSPSIRPDFSEIDWFDWLR